MGVYEEDRDSSQPNGTSKRGMIKLMLKLPSVRDDIKRSEGEPLLSLAEAYQIASEVLDKLRLSDKEDSSLFAEYEKVCREIELEVTEYCLSRRKNC